MFGGRASSGPAERALPILHFQATNAPKTFGGWAPLGPAGGAIKLLQLPSRGRCTGREHSLAAVRSALRRGRGWQYVEGAEMTEKGYF